jgi:hypothetical protein
LEQFEQQRKKVALRVISVTIILFVICVIILYNWPNKPSFSDEGADDFYISFFVFFILGVGFFYKILTSSYRKKFKKDVVSHIVTFVDENLTYYPNRMITRTEFQKSLLGNYWRSIDIWSGEDYVEGMLGFTAVKFSEVHAQHNSILKNEIETIFQGLFFKFDFNKDFKGFTVVLPKQGSLSKWLKYGIGPGEQVKLAEPEFEQKFIVYSDNQITARYVLSTDLMRRLLIFRSQLKRVVYFSFVNGTLYVGISIDKDLFEPWVFRTLLNYNYIREFSEYMQLAKDIVEHFKLNTRILSKDIVNTSQETSSSIRFKKF